MPGSLQAWYGPSDLEALGEREAVLSGELWARELTRLSALVHADCDGKVSISMRWRRTVGGQTAVELAYAVTLTLTCQRCLEPVEQRIDGTVTWVIVESDAEAKAVPAEFEPLVLAQDRLRPATLVEDELIVALPMVPRHGSIDECGALAQNFKDTLLDQDSGLAGSTLEV